MDWGGGRDGWVVKSTGCCSKGLQVDFQLSHVGSVPSVTASVGTASYCEFTGLRALYCWFYEEKLESTDIHTHRLVNLIYVL